MVRRQVRNMHQMRVRKTCEICMEIEAVASATMATRFTKVAGVTILANAIPEDKCRPNEKLLALHHVRPTIDQAQIVPLL